MRACVRMCVGRLACARSYIGPICRYKGPRTHMYLGKCEYVCVRVYGRERQER